MISYNGMKSEESKGGKMSALPAGPYVCKVLDTRIEGDAPDQQLAIVMDVIEGEHTGYFMNRFHSDKERSSGKYDVKFKGVYRLRIPNENNKNARYPESDISRFNDMIYRFEKSNEGFHFDGDEKKLKGLTVGINMQEAEFNGNAFTRIGRLEVAQDVRAGLIKPMQPKKERNRPGEVQDPTTGFTQVEEPVPF